MQEQSISRMREGQRQPERERERERERNIEREREREKEREMNSQPHRSNEEVSPKQQERHEKNGLALLRCARTGVGQWGGSP